MTSAPALSCPRCKRVLGPESWQGEHEGVCVRCDTRFEFLGFPALKAGQAAVAPQAAVLAEDSVCFFHAENRAEAICDGCGRLLCSVCAVPFGGQKLCPACMAGGNAASPAAVVGNRVLWDSLALAVAIFPLLAWPFTLVTAPVALGMVIYGWKKPASFVRGRSLWRLIVAGIFSLLEIGGWITLGIVLWLH